MICKTLKRLSNQLQPYHQVGELIMEILEARADLRVLCHLFSYAEFQFGERIPGKAYRQRENSCDRMDNWTVEIHCMVCIYKCLSATYAADASRNFRDRDNGMLPYCLKILEVLKPWSLCLDSRTDKMSKDEIHLILELSSNTECMIAAIYKNRDRYDVSESHYQRAISYARRYDHDGEMKTTLLLKALTGYCEVRTVWKDHAGALILAEEAYDIVAIAYNPVHPQVQEAAGKLIQCLTFKGDLDKAELFAQMTLDSLKDRANKVDQEGEEVAEGYFNVGRVLSFQPNGDLVKAEMLARESLRIRARLCGSNHFRVGSSIGLLASILRQQGSVGDEVRELYEHSLAIKVKTDGSDGGTAAVGNLNLGHFHYQVSQTNLSAGKRKEHLSVSKSYFKEGLRIYIKIFGLDHPDTIEAASCLSMISLELSEA
jgi:tetratricopeptide (TPR) repeat protein